MPFLLSMHLYPILHHGLALVFCGLFLGACMGFGSAVARLAPDGTGRNPGGEAALGVAVLSLIGGVLNLLHAVSDKICFGLVVAGLLLAWFDRTSIRRACLELKAVCLAHPLLAAVVTAVAGATLVGQFFCPDYSRYDDTPAYLVFPQKMLETGALGADFFSERRLESSLGAVYFLHAIVLSFAGLDYLHIIDPVIGMLIVMLFVHTTLGEANVPARWRLGASMISGLYVPQVVNLTATILPVALVLPIVWKARTLVASARFEPGRAVQIAMLGAAAAAMKSTLIPLVTVLLALSYGAAFALTTTMGLLVEGMLVVTVGIVALLPWMLSQLMDTGTLLYPLLGQGGFRSHGFDFATARNGGELLAIYLNDGVLTLAGFFTLALALVFVWCGWLRDKRLYVMPLLLPVLLISNAALCIGMGGEGLARYAYPAEAVCALGSLLLLLASAGSGRPDTSGRGRIGLGITVIVPVLAAALLVSRAWAIERYLDQAMRNVAMAVIGPSLRPQMLYSALQLNHHAVARDIAHMQDSAPVGAIILERLDYPFLMDFRRNQVAVADWPGGASPKPGLPLFHGPDAVAQYLLDQGIRYVAFAYGNEALFPKAGSERLLQSPWVLTDARNAYDFQDNLRMLMGTRHVLYDDGLRSMIDLGDRRSAAGTAASP